ncbi:MAG: hypothetical protein DLM59_20640 [Pseudonocardiales bacterium]|nr:MAG: hypothetical protein DLM59_20640 [Pseudonocardiales bacterium]
MDRLEVGITLVNQAATWVFGRGALNVEQVVGLAHRIAGALLLLGAILIVVTARPRWRSRAGATLVALVLAGVVFANWAPQASAATAGHADAMAAGGLPAGAIVTVAVVFVLTTIRVVWRVLWFTVRTVLLVLGVLRLVALFGGAVAAAVLLL